MLPSARALLTGIIDYAGTFPPAGLTLPEAVEAYRQVKRGANGWLVGRLIVAASAVQEFEELSQGREVGDVSVVFGPRPEARLQEVLAFAARGSTAYRVASVEFPPLSAADIRTMSQAVPETIERFFEVPIDADLERRISAVDASGALAKVRTGGTTPGVFPNPGDLVRFLEACADAAVAFKATAGLHHSIRGCYALTYDAGSATETMHGFLNLCVAAAIVHAGGAASEAVDALVESPAEMFRFGEDGIAWRSRTIANDTLAASRRFFRSFGSCSMREPVEELTSLRVI